MHPIDELRLPDGRQATCVSNYDEWRPHVKYMEAQMLASRPDDPAYEGRTCLSDMITEALNSFHEARRLRDLVTEERSETKPLRRKLWMAQGLLDVASTIFETELNDKTKLKLLEKIIELAQDDA